MTMLAGELYRAFILSDCPDCEVTEDTIISAVGSKDTTPPHASATILWEFVRKHKSDAQTRWFLGHAEHLEGIRLEPDSWPHFLEDESPDAAG